MASQIGRPGTEDAVVVGTWPGGGDTGTAVGADRDRSVPGDTAADQGSSRCRISRLVDWRRPLRTSALLAAASTLLWLVAFSSCRTYCLLAISLAGMVVMVMLRDMARSRARGAQLWHNMTSSWEMIDSGQDSQARPLLSDTFKLFLQETSSFKQQNPGKFCLLVCSLCTFFAVLGRYIPGIVISYILVLGIFLWPLISSHEFSLWLKPVLQKLDFGFGDFLRKIKENHEKRLLQSQAKKESIEEDLSSLFPKVDSTVCKEMSVSDTEVSDVTWTDNGTFNLSEGHTPQTENSEDLDREEAFTGGLPEFPSLNDGTGTNGDNDDDLSIGLPAPPPPAQPHTDHALELVHQMAGDVIAAAVTAAIQERIEAAVRGSTGAGDPGPLELGEDSDSYVEDFELLDQSELEHLEGELGLVDIKPQEGAKDQDKPPATAAPEASSAGFFSKLLGRH